MIEAYIDKIEFKNGLSVELGATSICVFVGPNNSGKSASLVDIRGLILEHVYYPIILSKLSILRKTTIEDIKTQYAEFRKPGGAYEIPGGGFHESHLSAWWAPNSPNLGPFFGAKLVSDLSTRARLADCDPPNSFDARTPFVGNHPFQHMYRDETLEAKASAAFRRAFKQDLVVHKAAGNRIPLYVGQQPQIRRGEDRVSRSYLDRLEKLDHLETQGDGIRSFVSIVGRVLTENRPIQLIDEPEAFLHPPQAKLVAEVVASDAGERQTFIATHSRDVLQGLLQKHAPRVSVVRLTRSAIGGRAAYLPSQRIADLWSDPILRFSDVLDGLFHDGVVVTEADADCRFYEAMANAVVHPGERPDIHYTYSGGKDRLPVVIRALVGLEVPVATIVDFDVLSSVQPLRKIVEAHGGNWSAYEADWRNVKAAVESKQSFLGGDRFKEEMTALLSKFAAGVAVPQETLKEIRKLARSASPWENVKSSGLAAISPGTPTVVAKRLLAALRKLGVFVAPMGEMEGFCRSIGSHGPRWVAEALTRDLAADPELLDARQFVGHVFGHLRSR